MNAVQKNTPQQITETGSDSATRSNKSDAIADKLRRDINFLQSRIEQISGMRQYSATTLKTYKSMLDSRREVLAQLNSAAQAKLHIARDLASSDEQSSSVKQNSVGAILVESYFDHH